MAVTLFEAIPNIFPPDEFDFFLLPRVKFGPEQEDGQLQRVLSGGPRWVAEIRYNIHLPDEIREWRGFVAKLSGGVTEILVPVRDRRQAPWPTGYDDESINPELPFDQDALFSDDTGFEQRIIVVDVASNAASGATTMTVDVVHSGDLKRGHYFSATDATGRQRLYVITEMPLDLGSDQFRIQFLPPLRSALTAGTPLEFDNPMCIMTVDRPDSGRLKLRPFFLGQPTLTLRESLTRTAVDGF